MPTKREKRQREYNHSCRIPPVDLFFFSSSCFHSPEASNVYLAQTAEPRSLSLSLRALFFALRSCFFSRFFFFYSSFIVAPGAERLATDVFSSLALLHRFFPRLPCSHSRPLCILSSFL